MIAHTRGRGFHADDTHRLTEEAPMTTTAPPARGVTEVPNIFGAYPLNDRPTPRPSGTDYSGRLF